MTRDELIAELKRAQAQCAAFAGDETELQRRMDAASKAHGLAVELAEQLDSPPAMVWQDEPSGDGWYWIEGHIGPWCVGLFEGRWWLTRGGTCGGRLNGRQVCPIPAPPPLPKRGDK